MPQLRSVKASASPSSTVYAVEGTRGDDGGFRKIIGLMARDGVSFYKSAKKVPAASPVGLIASGDIVLIKVNSQWNQRGGTNTDLVKAVIEAVTSHPDGFIGEVVVADNGQAQYGGAGQGGSLDWPESNALDHGQSIQRVADGFRGRSRVSTYLWDRITSRVAMEYADGDDSDGYVVSTGVNRQTGTIVSYPKFTTAHGTHISFRYGVWIGAEKGYDGGALKVINMPVLKSHFIYGLTGCVKSYMGVGSDKLTSSLGYRTHKAIATGAMGTLLAYTRFPTLNVLDAIHVNAKPGTGPSSSYHEATEAGIVAAGLDPVAVDSWAAREVLTPLAKSVHGLEAERFNPDSRTQGSFGSYLKPSVDELNAAGIRAVADPDAISVHVAPL